MQDAPLIAHSLRETRLYLSVTPCRACSQGPLTFSRAQALSDKDAGALVEISVTCACNHEDTYTFRLPIGVLSPGDEPPQEINSSDRPSRILDVAQWLTLFRMTTEIAKSETNKSRARELKLEAAECLEEALKFYEDDSDLPPEGGLFHQTSRARMRQNPELFSRVRLINMRSRLPAKGPSNASPNRE